jgi:hypothetical protein
MSVACPLLPTRVKVPLLSTVKTTRPTYSVVVGPAGMSDGKRMRMLCPVANAGRGRRLDRHGASETGAVSLSEPGVGVASSLDPAVLTDRPIVCRVNWTGPRGLWNAFASLHESDADSGEPGIAGPFNFSLAIPNSKAPSGISGSRLTMRWRSLSKPRCSLASWSRPPDSTVADRADSGRTAKPLIAARRWRYRPVAVIRLSARLTPRDDGGVRPPVPQSIPLPVPRRRCAVTLA